MNRTAGWLAAFAVAFTFCAPGAGMQPAGAQQRPAKANGEARTYRWVDKDGMVHFGDSVPPEYATTQKQILNDYGVPVATEDGAKTAEQRAIEQAAARKAAEERRQAILDSRRDQVLLDTYLSVEEIEALRDRRIELIDTQIRVTENYLQGLRDILQRLQAEAAGFKPYSPDPDALPIDERLAKELSNTMDSITLYEKNLTSTRGRKAELLAQFSADIKRFEELQAALGSN
ncbi:MAG: DUF4124 domain-containing protein [Gammaproteobacteria bacterium]|nr:DUF4124 domain-containing protein [Gammaproteobacteria bacterium]